MAISRRNALRAAATIAAIKPIVGESRAQTGTKIALVIGNASYLWAGTLQNPRRDARATAVLLEALGVETELLIDAERQPILAALDRFARRAAGAELALFVYAGHGIQRAGNNWLIPTDADADSGFDPAQQLINLHDAIAAMAHAQQRVALLDACRDDPMPGATPETQGLARMDDIPPGSLLCFATAPGRTALDGEGRHSPFTDALLDELGAPGLDLRQVLTRVRRRVLMVTSGRQVPWDNSSLTGDIVLRPHGLPAVPRPLADRETGTYRIPPSGGGGEAAPQVDVARFREMPRSYAHAARYGFGLPSGLLVEERTAAGHATPWTGAYFNQREGRLGLMLLSYDAGSGEATYVLMHAGSSPAGWSLRTARLEGSLLRDLTPEGALVRSVDLATGVWIEAADHISTGTATVARTE